MSRIFISYKRIDKEKVFKIKDQIEAALGEKCWIDIDGIESDAQFMNVIIRAINGCEIVLFMYSKIHTQIKDYEKDWTVRELNFAQKKNKRIVFINLDKTPLTDTFEFLYGTKQQVDGTKPQAVEKLILDLEKWLMVPCLVTSQGKSIKKQSNYSLLSKIVNTRNGIILCAVFILSLVIASFSFLHSNDEDYNSPKDMIELETTGTVNGHEWVDLGLPSGTKWATMNVGANSPIDYGSFFAWGETLSKSEYTKTNLKYSLDTAGYEFSKYVIDSKYGNVDGKKELEMSDDVAWANWGFGWSMPSNAQLEELCKSCNWTWINKDGFNGYNVIGPNGNSIFLPASGVRYGRILSNAGSIGGYWSRSLYLDSQWGAHFLFFDTSGIRTNYSYRRRGRSVRPVLAR